jgi:hypothetical protein
MISVPVPVHRSNDVGAAYRLYLKYISPHLDFGAHSLSVARARRRAALGVSNEAECRLTAVLPLLCRFAAAMQWRRK